MRAQIRQGAASKKQKVGHQKLLISWPDVAHEDDPLEPRSLLEAFAYQRIDFLSRIALSRMRGAFVPHPSLAPLDRRIQAIRFVSSDNSMRFIICWRSYCGILQQGKHPRIDLIWPPAWSTPPILRSQHTQPRSLLHVSVEDPTTVMRINYICITSLLRYHRRTFQE